MFESSRYWHRDRVGRMSSLGSRSLNANDLTIDSIWLLDLAKSLPSTQLDGFDVSAAGYPPKPWLPNNVSLNIWNAFEVPHEDYQGKYDLVHLRLFQIVIDNNDPSLLLQNCIKLLSQCQSVYNSDGRGTVLTSH